MLLAAIVFATQLTLEQKVGQLIQITPDELPNALAGSMLNAGDRVAEAQRGRKIPLLIGYDVIHGYRTIFPIPLAIASSWDPSLAEMSARIAAHEAHAAGVDWTFAPMVDIARDPRWGRIAEGAGEDPLLGARMAAAYVRGFQSEPGFLACAKHYAAYGGAEGGRDYNTVDMSEETLREIYLPPFRAAVDAGVWTLMSAFDALNGVPASANRHLLTDILRNEWGFKGFVVSDWDAVDQLIAHGVAADKQQAAIRAIEAGVDMDMHDEDYATLVDAVRSGRVAESVIDRALARVMRAKSYTRILHVPEPPLDREAARRIAQRSIVLLKNDGNLLPLSRTRKIAVVGPLADSKEDMLGPWASKGNGDDAISVADAIPSVPVEQADVVVAVLGETREMSGEASSRSSLDLPGDQEKYLESLVARGKPVVLVVMSGRPLSIAWAAEHVPAIVEAWFPGIEAGHAIADILFGDVNPSAKLPATVPRSVGQVPIYYNHLPTGRPPDPDDKYTSKYIDTAIGPLYPFGFGLSYTTFDYSDLRVDGLTISCTLRNSGSRPGEEIVQLYVNKPVSEVSRPVRELKGFQKIALRPGESRRVSFTLSPRDLAYWSASGWRTESGVYKVWIARDSASGLEGRFEISAKATLRPRSRQAPGPK